MSAVGVENNAQEGSTVVGATTTVDGGNTSIVSAGNRGGKGKRMPAKGKGKGGRGKGKGKGKHGGDSRKSAAGAGKNSNRSAMAGLNFPVGRIHRRLKENLLKKQRCAASSAIYCAALLEYITAEVFDLAGNLCKELDKKRITPRHLLLAIRGDEELGSVIKATISGGGIMPHLHAFLQKKKKAKKGVH